MGLLKLEPFEANGKFSLPLKKGKFVKKWYVKNLLKAIEWKEKYDEIGSEKA